MSMYYRSVGHGAVLLLNHTPDTTGRIPEADARRAAEFGAEIQRRFGKSRAETSGRGNVIELDLGKPTRLDHIISAEDIAEGERVREYVVEGFRGDAWRQLCEGTAKRHRHRAAQESVHPDPPGNVNGANWEEAVGEGPA